MPAAEEPTAKKQNGGAGRGQGKKPSATNAPGKDHADAPKRKQVSLGEGPATPEQVEAS